MRDSHFAIGSCAGGMDAIACVFYSTARWRFASNVSQRRRSWCEVIRPASSRPCHLPNDKSSCVLEWLSRSDRASHSFLGVSQRLSNVSFRIGMGKQKFPKCLNRSLSFLCVFGLGLFEELYPLLEIRNGGYISIQVSRAIHGELQKQEAYRRRRS